MKKKNLIILLLTAILCFSFPTSSVWAGSKHDYRRQGIAIGIGAAILGTALFGQYNRGYYSHHRSAIHRAPVYRYPTPRHRQHREGHWEMRKERVHPTYRRVWNPGHYNRHGEWVNGHWIKVVDQPGYWTKTRVWVSRR